MTDLLERGPDREPLLPALTWCRSRAVDGLTVAVAATLAIGVGVARADRLASPATAPGAGTSVSRVYGSRPAYDDEVTKSDNLKNAARGFAGAASVAPSEASVRLALADVASQLCSGVTGLVVRDSGVSADFRRADFTVTAKTYYNSVKDRIADGTFTVRLYYRAGWYVFEAERRGGECLPT